MPCEVNLNAYYCHVPFYSSTSILFAKKYLAMVWKLYTLINYVVLFLIHETLTHISFFYSLFDEKLSSNFLLHHWHYLPWIHPPGYGPFKKPNPIIRIIFKTYFFQMHYSWFYLSCHASHIILCLVWMHTVESLKFVGINFHGLSTFLSWFIFVGLLVHLTGMHNV